MTHVDGSLSEGNGGKPVDKGNRRTDSMMLRKILILTLFFPFGGATALEQRVNLPDVTALGMRVVEKVRLVSSSGREAIWPATVSYSLQKGRISVIQAVYPRGVSFDLVRREINRHYGKFEQAAAGTAQRPWRYWHLPKKVEIQMQITMGDFVEVIFLTSESFDW